MNDETILSQIEQLRKSGDKKLDVSYITNESFSVYMILNVITNQLYIGQTKDVQGRIRNHYSSARTGKFPLYESMRNYGTGAFEVYVLEENLSIECVNDREIYWIGVYGAIGPNGFNKAPGDGRAGIKPKEPKPPKPPKLPKLKEFEFKEPKFKVKKPIMLSKADKELFEWMKVYPDDNLCDNIYDIDEDVKPVIPEFKEPKQPKPKEPKQPKQPKPKEPKPKSNELRWVPISTNRKSG